MSLQQSASSFGLAERFALQCQSLAWQQQRCARALAGCVRDDSRGCAQQRREHIEEAGNELMLADEDEMRYVVGDAFVAMPNDAAEGLLSKGAHGATSCALFSEHSRARTRACIRFLVTSELNSEARIRLSYPIGTNLSRAFAWLRFLLSFRLSGLPEAAIPYPVLRRSK